MTAFTSVAVTFGALFLIDRVRSQFRTGGLRGSNGGNDYNEC